MQNSVGLTFFAAEEVATSSTLNTTRSRSRKQSTAALLDETQSSRGLNRTSTQTAHVDDTHSARGRTGSIAGASSRRESSTAAGDLIEDEIAATNRVKLEVYLYYARAVGVWMSTSGTLCYAFFKGFEVTGSIWLSQWSNDQEANFDDKLRNKYLIVYAVLGLAQTVALVSGIIFITIGTLRASVSLHDHMLRHIMSSTMAFFDTTPLGRIINRFSKDFDEVDLMIPQNIKDILTDGFSVLGTLVIVIYSSPITLAAIVPILLASAFIQGLYLSCSRQIKRMVSVTRSPINSSITESFSGAATIRAFKMQKSFISAMEQRTELNQKFYFMELTSNAWLFSRLESTVNLLIFFVSLFAVIFRESADPGLVGLSLTYAFTFQLDVFLFTRNIANIEKSIVSVERIREYQNTPVEAPAQLPSDHQLPKDWPDQGSVEFCNYATRYRYVSRIFFLFFLSVVIYGH